MFFRLGFFIVITALSACSGFSTVIVGEVTQQVDTDQVEVFYTRQPDCDFDVVAWIQLPGEYLTRESLIKLMQFKAANLGASAIQVTFIQKTGTSTYRGSGRALRCLS